MPSDYRREDENETTIRRIRCYSDPTHITDVAVENGLRCELVKFSHWPCVVVKIWADRKTFKACQYIWLARMIAEPQTTEIEL